MGPALINSDAAFKQSVKYWQERTAVGKVGEDPTLQTYRIESALRSVLEPATYFNHCLDFGCGNGRMLPLLAELSGHVWCADIVDRLQPSPKLALTYTKVRLDEPGNIPLKPTSMDFVFVCLVLQHIIDDSLFAATAEAIKKTMRPAATVVIIDNSKDRAYHVRSRHSSELSRAFGLAHVEVRSITINNRANDHWLIKGVFNGKM